MSYIKTEWDNGDIITAEKLNNIESGISDGGVTIFTDTFDDETQIGTLNATYQEVVDAALAVLKGTLDRGGGSTSTYCDTLTETGLSDGQYWVTFGEASFYANSPNEPMTNPPPGEGE